ncbi:unnamed protein product [Bemisia tabaci]|uniref:alpha-1,2-Mannosidase n=3 Tax=Bemisia tabaci TaxID=7038 RepID=A0A9P0F1M5_BEMTA|nr:unnamed protein product [Bemisia tabaci]
MFDHAYSSYLFHAYPYDELRPISCDGVDTWGSYSLSLIDALDTLVVMGNYSEFRRVVEIVTNEIYFDADINVSVFETNIRILGGLLSAHLFSKRAGLALEEEWPCNGPLLRLAEDVAKRLLPAFDTATGMPYGTVNLRHGVPHGETSITCTAGVGTFILEFGTLSRLTGNPIYEETALRALHALRNFRSPIGLYGNHLDVTNGRWTAQDSGIGAGVDSYFEYLVKGAILLQRPELMEMFHETKPAIDSYLKKDDWYLWVSMMKGQVTMPVFQSLEAYWPGVLSLIGNVSEGLKSIQNYKLVWKHFGFTPEVFNILQSEISTGREGYPLRPELAESVMYLYKVTKDPALLDIGIGILRSIQHSATTPCGYATIKDAKTHTQEDRMESFFLSELTKYLYLLFDPDNFIHNPGGHSSFVEIESGKQCIIGAGGYLFNTEAHPLDPGALECCKNFHSHQNFKESSNQSAVSWTSGNHRRSLDISLEQTSSFGEEIRNETNASGCISESHPNKVLSSSKGTNCVTSENISNLSNSDIRHMYNDLIKNESVIIDHYLNNIFNSLTFSHKGITMNDTSLSDLIDVTFNRSCSLERELSDLRNLLQVFSVLKAEQEMYLTDFCDSIFDVTFTWTHEAFHISSDDLIPSFFESVDLSDKKWSRSSPGITVDNEDKISPVADTYRINLVQNSDLKDNALTLNEQLKRNSSLYPATNLTFNHEHLLCSAQSFKSRLMLSGEFFSTFTV